MRPRPHRHAGSASSTPASQPDIVTMAKALGNGVPIGACWARAEVAAAFAPGDHATTFGGQPLAARAALAMLDVMEREDVPERGRARGRAARRRRCRRSTASPTCAAPGLLIAAELAPGLDAKAVAQRCLDARAGAQRGDAERAAARAAAARHRRRDRRSGRDHRGRVRDESATHDADRSSRSTISIPARLAAILDHAIAWKADPGAVPPVLAGQGVAALFEKPSARTRISIEMAVATLGGHPIYVRAEEVGLDARESVEDVARTMAGMCAVIAARVFDHRTLERMEAVGRRPGRQPAVRPRASVPGARRPADPARALRRARRPPGRVRRRRQQRRRVARVRRRAVGRRARRSRRPRATSSTPTSSTGPAISAARSS